MMFVTISPQQAAQYSYMCLRLKQMVNKMHLARKTLEGIANSSFDKTFAKCVYMLTSESMQCENEIRAQIDSLNCTGYQEDEIETQKPPLLNSINGIESVCNYLEESYLNSYKKLLNDKRLGNTLKSLIQNHLDLFISSITQLRLFNDVKTVMN